MKFLEKNLEDIIYETTEKQIEVSAVLNYAIKARKDYLGGGFYLIRHIDSGMCYVGKSIDFMARLKQHTFKSKSKTLIDSALNQYGISSFNFYLLHSYDDLGINFFNRKAESIIEHGLITRYNSISPNGFNRRHYGHL